ncbi:MAG: hypothetical protein C0507_10560 [Cyanobacteria bacterium PR.3.49]|nr:hypothetical protein [Cyanobacteria bacterium PR.3.49]
MSLNYRPPSFSTPSSGADLAGNGGHELLKGSLSAGGEAAVGGVDLSRMQVSYQPTFDAAAANAVPSGIELTGTMPPAPTGMEAQALASFAPPPMDASPMVAALAGANEPISPIIQLIMRMPGAMGLMNSFFEALGQFFFAQPLAGLLDNQLFAQLGAVASQFKIGMPGTPGLPGLEHSAINMSLLPQNAPIFGSLGSMGAHGFTGMSFDSLASKFATAPQLNVSPEHFAVNKLNVSGGLDLSKPQFEWSSKFGGQGAGGEMLSGPQLSDGKLASHLGGTQRLFSDKLQASSGFAPNRMPMNTPNLANNNLNQSLSQSLPLSSSSSSALNVSNHSYTLGGQPSGGISASGSMRDVVAPTADNNVGFRMGQQTAGNTASIDAAPSATDAVSSDNMLAYNNNGESFKPTMGGMEKGVQTMSDSGSQWTQPQAVAKPAIKLEGLKAKQLTFDSLKDAGTKATPASHSAASAGHHAAAKPVMDYQGHQLKAGGAHAGRGMDGISHRNLSGVQYHKPQVSHQIAKPQPQRVETQPAQQQFKSEQIAQNQTDLQPANTTDATSVVGDQAVGASTGAATSSTYTIRAGDCLWNIAKNQMGDALKWQDIFNANKDILGSNPDLIQPGTTINLPGQEVAANQASNYVVKSGDSLWKISQDLLGDGSRWNELYQANASIIGENPRMIMPGQELSILGMDGADTLAQAGTAGTQSAQAAGQQTLQSASQVPAGDAQQAFSAQPQGMEAQSMQAQSAPQEVPQMQDQPIQSQPMQSIPQSGTNAQALPQAQMQQVQPASYQQQAPANYQPLPAANLPADKNAVVSSTMVPTDIVEMFRKAK